MLSLVLRGKQAVTEDVLTAAVFDAIADQRDRSLLTSSLETARGLHGSIVLPACDAFEVELWPRLASGEPDVRIRLLHHDAQVGTVLVEAKLWAPKSGTGGADENGRPRDQLARYLLDEVQRDPSVVLVYLTHHLVLPADDLADSVEHLNAAGRGDLIGRLFWSPWRAFELELGRACKVTPSYSRVRAVLRQARMFWFDGIDRSARLSFKSSPLFYRTNPITYRWPRLERVPGARWPYRRGVNVGGTSLRYVWPAQDSRMRPSHFYDGGDQ